VVVKPGGLTKIPSARSPDALTMESYENNDEAFWEFGGKTYQTYDNAQPP
jgi:hypothetical protein